MAQPGQQRTVERNATPLLLGDRPLKAGAKQRMRERRSDGRNEVREQPGKRAHVVFAVAQNVLPLLGAERRALQYPLPHVVLAGEVELV